MVCITRLSIYFHFQFECKANSIHLQFKELLIKKNAFAFVNHIRAYSLKLVMWGEKIQQFRSFYFPVFDLVRIIHRKTGVEKTRKYR